MLRKRTYHYLSQLPERQWPKRVLILAVESESAPVEGSKSDREERLSKWHLAELQITSDGSEITWQETGESESAFWLILTRTLNRSMLTQLYCFSAVRSMTLLNLWQRLESQSWTLGNKHGPEDMAKGTPDHNRGRGYIVIDDPPTIIRVRPKGKRAWVEIRGLENYGIEETLYGNSAKTAIARTADGVQEWLGALRCGNLGAPQATAAAQAWYCFRRSHLDCPILVHANASALRLERQAIHAGRNECFHMGRWNGPIYQLDFASHYPACCIDAPMPCRLRGYSPDCKIPLAKLWADGYQCIAEVSLSTSEPNYPYKRGHESIYPVGTYCTVLPNAELQLAHGAGDIIAVGRCAWYEPDNALTGWAKHMLACRASAGHGGGGNQSVAVKRIANSLFGRFAQRTWRWLEWPEAHCESAFCQWFDKYPEGFDNVQRPKTGQGTEAGGNRQLDTLYAKWRCIGWKKEVQLPEEEPHDSLPAIAAQIYSLGRVKLLEAIRIAGVRNLFYVDTDSLWVNETGYQAIGKHYQTDSQVPGALRLKDVHNRIILYGLKQVETDKTLIASGLPHSERHQVNGDYRHYVSERMESALKQSRFPNTVRRMASYRMGGKYRHGILCRDGHIIPLSIFDVQTNRLTARDYVR